MKSIVNRVLYLCKCYVSKIYIFFGGPATICEAVQQAVATTSTTGGSVSTNSSNHSRLQPSEDPYSDVSDLELGPGDFIDAPAKSVSVWPGDTGATR